MMLAETAGQIVDHLERATGSVVGQLDDPGVMRLATLVGDARLVYLDAAGTPSSGGRFVGTIVVMTDTLVLRWVRQASADGSEPADSSVEAWPRSTVNHLAVLGADEAFHRATESRPLPTGCQIQITYENGRQLTLPLRPDVGTTAVGGAELLPRLREELAGKR